MNTFLGILIPFLGTTLGACCVFFMRRSLGERVHRMLTGFAAGVMRAAGNYINTILTQCGLFASALWRWQSR